MISIEDRMAILELATRYNYAVDTGAGEAFANTFTAEGVFDGPAGHAAGRAALVVFCGELAVQFPGGMHFTDNHLFDVDGDVVRHKCFLSFQVPGENGTEPWLLGYEDEVVKEDGEWKFQLRKVGPLQAL